MRRILASVIVDGIEYGMDNNYPGLERIGNLPYEFEKYWQMDRSDWYFAKKWQVDHNIKVFTAS